MLEASGTKPWAGSVHICFQQMVMSDRHPCLSLNILSKSDAGSIWDETMGWKRAHLLPANGYV
jgi:hypothetical protein